MHFAVLVSAFAAVALAAPAPAPQSGPSALREQYFPGGHIEAIDKDLPNLGGRPYFSARFWRKFFDKYPDRVPAIGATVEECTQNYVDLVTELGDPDRRRIHSYRSQCEDWHDVARCDKACVRAGIKGKQPHRARRAAIMKLKWTRPAAAAGRSLLKMESRAAAAAAAALRAAEGHRGRETGAVEGVWQELKRPFGMGAVE
ncbi:MAG: hypothetical protein M1826_001337 [Phylliscum demangeonii]|nr:MAG: hypothetical protein M1826_001337 [Phylliscum demangeonii]